MRNLSQNQAQGEQIRGQKQRKDGERKRERGNKQNQNRRQYYLTIRYRKRKNTTKLLSSI